MTFLTSTAPFSMSPARLQKAIAAIPAQHAGNTACDTAYHRAVADARDAMRHKARKELSGARRKMLEIALSDLAGC